MVGRPYGLITEPASRLRSPRLLSRETFMNSIIYLIGLIVVVLAILSFLGIG